MILFPAIDLKDGKCVRLVHGLMDQATVFNDNPAAQAKSFEDAGFEYLHLVDLNGAFEGRPVNAHAVDGIRDLATIETWLGKGIARVIIGTAALKNPALVSEACRKFPGRVAVGLDARDGRIAVEGWAEMSDVTALDLAHRFEDEGVAAIVYTDISRDGAMQGLNIEATVALADAISTPVIASGGLSSLDDVKRLIATKCKGIEGAISGRALYDGRLDPREVLSLLGRSS